MADMMNAGSNILINLDKVHRVVFDGNVIHVFSDDLEFGILARSYHGVQWITRFDFLCASTPSAGITQNGGAGRRVKYGWGDMQDWETLTFPFHHRIVASASHYGKDNNIEFQCHKTACGHLNVTRLAPVKSDETDY